MRHALALSLLVVLSGCWDDPQKKPVASKEPAAAEVTTMTDYSKLTDADWKARLTEEQYEVTRHKGTERAGSGCYAHSHEPGTYLCVCCGQPLFKSETKFESGTGWPSFWQPVDKGAVKEIEDRSYGMVRTEVECSRCGAHLGHVFDDGPQPTGLRYCMNSASLKLEKKASGP